MNRTIATAVGRVVANHKLEYKGDLMYGISDVFLWAWAESTCVLLVFCMLIWHYFPLFIKFLMLIFFVLLRCTCYSQNLLRYAARPKDHYYSPFPLDISISFARREHCNWESWEYRPTIPAQDISNNRSQHMEPFHRNPSCFSPKSWNRPSYWHWSARGTSVVCSIAESWVRISSLWQEVIIRTKRRKYEQRAADRVTIATLAPSLPQQSLLGSD